MTSRLAVCLALGLVALADAPLQAQFRGRGGPPAFGHGWLPSLAAGMARARDSGRPLMVVIRCVP